MELAPELEGGTPGRRGSTSGNSGWRRTRDRDGKRQGHMCPRLPPARSLLPAALGGSVVSEQTRGALSAAPAPARDPRGPRLLYLACPSRHPGLLHQGPHWHSGRERERAAGQVAGGRLSPGSWQPGGGGGSARGAR